MARSALATSSDHETPAIEDSSKTGTPLRSKPSVFRDKPPRPPPHPEREYHIQYEHRQLKQMPSFCALPDLEENLYTRAGSTTQGTKVPKDPVSMPQVHQSRSIVSARDPDWLVEDEGERVVGHLAKSSKAIQINARMTAMLKRIVGTSTSKQRPHEIMVLHRGNGESAVIDNTNGRHEEDVVCFLRHGCQNFSGPVGNLFHFVEDKDDGGQHGQTGKGGIIAARRILPRSQNSIGNLPLGRSGAF